LALWAAVRAGTSRRPRSYGWIVAVLVALAVAIAALGISVDLLATRTAATPLPPSVRILANTTTGGHPLSVSFGADASGGQAPFSYGWNFGDGGMASGKAPHHTFLSRGQFNVSLLVTDATGRSGVANLSINVLAVSQSVIVENSSGASLGAGVSNAWILPVPIPTGTLSAWLHGTINVTACPHDDKCKIEAEVLSLAGVTAFLQGDPVQPIWCSQVGTTCAALPTVTVSANLSAWPGTTLFLVVWNPDPKHLLTVSAFLALGSVD
jgi:PKD repeat protein